MMTAGSDARHFSVSYAEARTKFLAGATARGMTLSSQVLPGYRGIAGEDLALDVGRCGAPNARSLLLVLSGTHGIEGYCGSGVQTALLADDAMFADIAAAGIGVLFVHAVNPYGFSHQRRVNEDNVDLNRNFRDFDEASTPNAGYAEIHPLLLPATWPPAPDVERALSAYVAERGMAAMQAAMTAGQCEFPRGLFFAGRRPTWSNRVLREMLRREGAGATRIGLIDLHTGLGPTGHGEKIFAARDDAATLARARRWWGPEVTSFYDGSSTSALLSGVLFNAVYEECPAAEYTGIALEFGTEPLPEVLAALRAEGWLRLNPEAPRALAATIQARMRAAFYVEDDGWKATVTMQARAAVRQALEGLQ
jgi:hypothetical protein